MNIFTGLTKTSSLLHQRGWRSAEKIRPFFQNASSSAAPTISTIGSPNPVWSLAAATLECQRLGTAKFVRNAGTEGLPDFSRYVQHAKRGENIPNGHEIDLMAVPQWQYHNGSTTMAVPQWQYHNSSTTMAVPQWQYRNGSTTMAVPQWQYHNGNTIDQHH
jgi:hypothetical protein